MSQPIVHKDKAVTTAINPFAKPVAEHLSAGAVTIESERAIAEAQGKLVIAKRFPRDQAGAYSRIIDACKRPGLAEEACYSFPRAGQTISGPSIRLAEMLAANWGNIDYGIRELSRKEGVSEMEAYAWDLETNTHSSQKFTVRHIRDKRDGQVRLTDERDIYELTANMGGRRLRARILAILPADLVQAAVDECGRTLAGGNDIPIPDRIRAMVTAFKALGVTTQLIEMRLGHKLDVTTPDELGELRKIHNSIRDGISKAVDWFGFVPGDAPAQPQEEMPGDPPAASVEGVRPPPPPRKPRGAKAALAAQPAEEPKPAEPAEPEQPAPAPADEIPGDPPEKPAKRTTLEADEIVDSRFTLDTPKVHTVKGADSKDKHYVACVVNNEQFENLGVYDWNGAPDGTLKPCYTPGGNVRLKLLGKKQGAMNVVKAMVQEVADAP